MYVKTINYTDYDDNPREMTAHFHLSKADLAVLRLTDERWDEDYLNSLMEKVQKERENKKPDKKVMKEMLDFIREFIRASYGHREGDSFIHDEADTEKFMNSEAYSEFFVELNTHPDKQSAFVNAVMSATPAERAEIQKMVNEAIESDE